MNGHLHRRSNPSRHTTGRMSGLAWLLDSFRAHRLVLQREHGVDKLRKLARESDAVVLMSMMRPLLGRTIRAALNDPPRLWVPCTGRGKQALTESIRRAAIVGCGSGMQGVMKRIRQKLADMRHPLSQAMDMIQNRMGALCPMLQP